MKMNYTYVYRFLTFSILLLSFSKTAKILKPSKTNRLQIKPKHHGQNDPFHLQPHLPYEYEERYSYSSIPGTAACTHTESPPWKSTPQSLPSRLHVWYSDSYCTSRCCPSRCRSDRSHRTRSPRTHQTSRRSARAPAARRHMRSGHHAPSTGEGAHTALLLPYADRRRGHDLPEAGGWNEGVSTWGIKGYTNMLLIPRARAWILSSTRCFRRW